MLDVELRFNDINISNIKKSDLPQIQTWMKLQKQFVHDETDLEELKERFLESYISECEFFLKINREQELLGIIKGRLEFKNPNEAWIWYFYIDDKYRTANLNNKIMEELLNYFLCEYDVDIFCTRIIKNDRESLEFWKNIGFKSVRMVKDFYSINGKYMDMLIMKRVEV
ncbi:GNAT family N-acetyltransferase [Clostridium aciditolerans]|uniref:GNAT family N-acetyltransferase n=1 Tax=Clostridium aciditolerans TaxID=339861 RepID=A0A934HY42_9CLOT|nr:GNAT family N-acetyltransferase [Clostridium aciditolerans]MBI6871661.1 GNAT family N-acetyltransferase [Clostridium aciditolerans]